MPRATTFDRSPSPAWMDGPAPSTSPPQICYRREFPRACRRVRDTTFLPQSPRSPAARRSNHRFAIPDTHPPAVPACRPPVCSPPRHRSSLLSSHLPLHVQTGRPYGIRLSNRRRVVLLTRSSVSCPAWTSSARRPAQAIVGVLPCSGNRRRVVLLRQSSACYPPGRAL